MENSVLVLLATFWHALLVCIHLPFAQLFKTGLASVYKITSRMPFSLLSILLCELADYSDYHPHTHLNQQQSYSHLIYILKDSHLIYMYIVAGSWLSQIPFKITEISSFLTRSSLEGLMKTDWVIEVQEVSNTWTGWLIDWLIGKQPKNAIIHLSQ